MQRNRIIPIQKIEKKYMEMDYFMFLIEIMPIK